MGQLPPPITSADSPLSVPGERSLTQAINGPHEDATPYTRGLRPAPLTADVPALSGRAMPPLPYGVAEAAPAPAPTVGSASVP